MIDFIDSATELAWFRILMQNQRATRRPPPLFRRRRSGYPRGDKCPAADPRARIQDKIPGLSAGRPGCRPFARRPNARRGSTPPLATDQGGTECRSCCPPSLTGRHHDAGWRSIRPMPDRNSVHSSVASVGRVRRGSSESGIGGFRTVSYPDRLSPLLYVIMSSTI
jgi:hypothetical protein